MLSKPINLILIFFIILFCWVGISELNKNKIIPETPEQNEPESNHLPVEPIKPSKPEIKEPEWINYPKIRNVTNLGKVLSDVESHIRANNPYRDNDLITSAHEQLHGINSDIRNKYTNLGKINAFYCLNDKAVIIKEPKVTINAVANAIPFSIRDDLYQLYLVGGQHDWNNEPLYLVDEWVAYTTGSLAQLDLKIPDHGSAVNVAKFNIYINYLTKVIKEKDPNYDDTQYSRFVAWNMERTKYILDQSGLVDLHNAIQFEVKGCRNVRKFD